jgi:hypothetical protein
LLSLKTDDLLDSLVSRIEALNAPETPSAERVKAELARCASDIVFWVNTYCWTYDPREDEPDIKITLYAHQEGFLRWLVERLETKTGGVAEKCRDVGFTWLCGYFEVWCWLFRKGFKGGFGSRKLDLVDDSDGDADDDDVSISTGSGVTVPGGGGSLSFIVSPMRAI